MIERLAEYVAIRSLSREERALAERVTADLQGAGLKVTREGANLWTEIGDQARPRLLLNSHLDTVPPGEGWNDDPWQLVRKDGRLIGLGANDAKGCGVAMIEALLALQRALGGGGRLGGTVVLALTAEEETTGAGLGEVLARLGPLDAALVGEPTGLTPMVAQRGLLILRGVASGRTSHPANTLTDERNAVAIAARDIAALGDFDWGPEHVLLGRAHGQVTRVSGGVANNVVPDRCEFVVDIRTTPAESHARLRQRLQSRMSSALEVHSDRLVPVETRVDAPIVQAVLEALPGAQPSGSRAMSDMVFLADTPAVKIGPGDSQRSHTPNEFLLERELIEGAAAYERIVRMYFRRMKGS